MLSCSRAMVKPLALLRRVQAGQACGNLLIIHSDSSALTAIRRWPQTRLIVLECCAGAVLVSSIVKRPATLDQQLTDWKTSLRTVFQSMHPMQVQRVTKPPRPDPQLQAALDPVANGSDCLQGASSRHACPSNRSVLPCHVHTPGTPILGLCTCRSKFKYCRN
jgi:hypothetical protein